MSNLFNSTFHPPLLHGSKLIQTSEDINAHTKLIAITAHTALCLKGSLHG